MKKNILVLFLVIGFFSGGLVFAQTPPDQCKYSSDCNGNNQACCFVGAQGGYWQCQAPCFGAGCGSGCPLVGGAGGRLSNYQKNDNVQFEDNLKSQLTSLPKVRRELSNWITNLFPVRLPVKLACSENDPGYPNCGEGGGGNSCNLNLGSTNCACGPIISLNQHCAILKNLMGLGVGDLVVRGTYMPFTVNARLFKSANSFCKCLSANTAIATQSGNVNVKNLKLGMLVWTKDKGERVLEPIVKLSNMSVKNHQVVHLILADGRTVDVSANHPTADGHLVGDLKAGQVYDSSLIKSVNLIDYKYDKTYDLLPAGDTGYYWADGILMGSTLK